MIRPYPCACMRRAAFRASSKGATRSASRTRRTDGRSNSYRPRRSRMPTLFTRMSSREEVSAMCSNAASTPSRSVTSNAISRAISPASRIACVALLKASRCRPLRYTVAPAAARPRAISNPRPRVEPVTRAVLPDRENKSLKGWMTQATGTGCERSLPLSNEHAERPRASNASPRSAQA
jgi:hypothetical protein